MSRGVRALWALGFGLVVVFTLTFAAAAAVGLEDEATWQAWLSADVVSSWLAALIVVGTLAVDLVLPVPSSLVMTWSGHVLGLLVGAAASSVGALAGAFIGFEACRRLGRPAFARLVGEEELPAVRQAFDRWGSWIVLVSRPVPMLTETISCLAGLSGMAPSRFLGLSAAGTVPLCLLYSWVGANARSAEQVGAAVLLAVGVPAMGFGIARARGLL